VLAALDGTPGVVQTVLSGTLRSGWAKLELFGLDGWLDPSCAVGGEDADTRPGLVAVAWRRARKVHGHSYAGTDTVIVGDTPLDVDAALRNGCRIVAVATGTTTAGKLVEAGADIVLPDPGSQRCALEAIIGQ
jgi:phosphoglycolate phosphatase-like HAD superfamily hydrolase